MSGGMEAISSRPSQKIGNGGADGGQHTREWCGHFQMPLHYPRYTQADYETMPEWKLDCLLREYGLPIIGDVDHKRKFAMGSFLWPH
ncbi:hypothetical protein SO802_022189 [Lithocarpus litseifolius]|uniref:DUF7722 domain-containing protein n=1 Tax=Lithocarpus litseifolius TaxID=425828 RepID=A0AAW2CJ14_9ROSI